ncbi:MAG: ACP S-malonyltransferase [Lysobacterales bacterium]
MTHSRNELALVFPGQGSQTLGMLSALAEAYPVVRATFDAASAAIDLDLWQLAQQGPEADLNLTVNTQPALLAADVAVWRAYQAAGGSEPACLAGHSLGEYAALVCADALSLEDATRLVRERGRLMQAAVPEGAGAMAAVLNADLDLLTRVCQEASTAGAEVVPANLNAPGQIVISGAASALARALELLQAHGIKRAIRLPVSVPSHSPLMRDAATRLGEFLLGIEIRRPRLRVIHNADVGSHTDPADIRAALVRQLYAPVRWIETVELMAASGITTVYECGPGKVLCGMIKRISPSITASSMADPEGLLTAVAGVSHV